MMQDAAGWETPRVPPGIGPDEVHVWRAPLDSPPSVLRRLEAILTPDEISRATRFRFAVHRNRFVQRRGVLRLLLAGWLGVPPADVGIEYTVHGKPVLSARHATDLRFNLSSSEDLALYAFSRGRDLGLDVERIRPGVAEESVAERFFAPAEVAALRALPESRQPVAFFDCWARKEAYVKAQGMGLSLALDSFEVSFGDGGPARLLRTAPDPREAARWTMVALAPAPGFAGALVHAGPACLVRLWHWHSDGGRPDAFQPEYENAPSSGP
jgi:4'-phosphopantetheinyl transferase